MDAHVKPYKIFMVDGIKVGVYGLGIELDGLVTKKLYKETQYLDPFEIAQDTESVLKNEKGCDLVICLSHLGYNYQSKTKPSDLILASKTSYTDLIIGGHTHTFLEKPTVTQNKIGKDILVNQVGCFGINLGRIDFYFDQLKNSQSEGVTITV